MDFEYVVEDWSSLAPDDDPKDIDDVSACQAAEHGHREALEWLLEKKAKFSPWPFVEAAKKANFPLMEFLLPTVPKPYKKYATANAADSGRIDVLEWMLSRGFPMTKLTLVNAAMSGSVELFKWVRARVGLPFTTPASFIR